MITRTSLTLSFAQPLSISESAIPKRSDPISGILIYVIGQRLAR